MNNFKLIADAVDCTASLIELELNKYLWDAFTMRQNVPGTAHGDTRCIPLRAPKELTIEAVFNDIEASPTEFTKLLPLTTRLMKQTIKKIGEGQVGRVMVVDLLSGGYIDKHYDDGTYSDYYDRFHLVMYSEEGNQFRCGNEIKEFAAGELWMFNHKIEHEVVNLSGSSRIHMILDVRKEYQWESQQASLAQ